MKDADLAKEDHTDPRPCPLFNTTTKINQQSFNVVPADRTAYGSRKERQ